MKKSKFTLLFVLLFILSFSSRSQDTITVLHYNLLYYGVVTDFCTSSNNDVVEKTEYLKTIINYIEPDIFSVNELSPSATYHNYIRDNVFVLNGYTNYEHGEVKGDYITSQIFYNTTKLTLQSEDEIYAYPRDVHVYKFYYNSQELADLDTAFFYCFVAHLKAGSDNDDEDDRASATSSVMNYVANLGVGNYLFIGDLNFYTNMEEGYLNLTDPSKTDIKFNDPVNAEGEWHDDVDYAQYHTQSTHYYGSCAAGGGMDDRFDFILASNHIMTETNTVHYISDSYNTVGQDGLHFNSGIDYGANNSVPDDVLDALANGSDHLPVSLKIEIEQTPIWVHEIQQNNISVKINNPVKDNLFIQIFTSNMNKSKTLNAQIYSSQGQLITSDNILINEDMVEYNISVSHLKEGLYFLKITDGNSLFYTTKFIKF